MPRFGIPRGRNGPETIAGLRLHALERRPRGRRPDVAAATAPPYAQTAAALGMTEGAAKVAVHRLRERYRAMLRLEITATLGNPAGTDEELRELFEALAP